LVIQYRWVARAAAYDEQIAELVSLAETKAIGAKAKEWAERKRSSRACMGKGDKLLAKKT